MLTAEELDAYCLRIGYAGPREPTLAVLRALSAAHVTTIPFENLDVLLGRGVSLEPADVFDKLVRRRRGGYCFEQNGLFLEVLAAFGFATSPLGARVRWQRPRDFTPPRTHLFARVELDGESWVADVGVGAMSLTAPIRLFHDGEQATPHEPRRIVKELDERGDVRWFHQARLGDVWHDVAELTLDVVPWVDREVGNWFTSAHPRSHFRNRMLVARATVEGRVTLLDRELSIRGHDGVAVKRTIDDPDELLAVLAEHFGLAFPAGTRFGGPGSPWAS